MTVSGDVAKKLKEGNSSFVVGYNNPNQYEEKQPEKPVYKHKWQ